VPEVALPHAALGAYGSFEAKGQPAWDISRDSKLVADYGDGLDGVVVLRCNCGKVIRLLDHRIKPDGTIEPSVWHDVPGCGWHVFARLEEWSPAALQLLEPGPPTKR
jgi:hypothetical protein